MILFGPVFSGYLLGDDEGSAESRALQKVLLLGGEVTKNETQPGGSVVGLSFRGSKRFGDGYLPLLKEFPRPAFLDLIGTKVTDHGMKEIRELKSLNKLWIWLNSTLITDEGMKQIGKLQNLVYLDLSENRITDASLPRIQVLDRLEMINLEDTDITPGGLAAQRASRKKIYINNSK